MCKGVNKLKAEVRRRAMNSQGNLPSNSLFNEPFVGAWRDTKSDYSLDTTEDITTDCSEVWHHRHVIPAFTCRYHSSSAFPTFSPPIHSSQSQWCLSFHFVVIQSFPGSPMHEYINALSRRDMIAPCRGTPPPSSSCFDARIRFIVIAISPYIVLCLII